MVFKQQMFSWLTVRKVTVLISRSKILTFSCAKKTEILNKLLGIYLIKLVVAESSPALILSPVDFFNIVEGELYEGSLISGFVEEVEKVVASIWEGKVLR